MIVWVREREYNKGELLRGGKKNEQKGLNYRDES